MAIPEQWLRVKEIVGAALECEQDQRGAFLDSACFQDEQLRAEVESLIEAYERSSSLSGGLSGDNWNADSEQDTETPTQIGPYRIERELGSGGMGQVWLAEQLEPVHRYVALKLIRADFRNREVAQRFLAERQSLALMNHPSIAKVFDAGTTPAGQHYLVMEYVDGCPITEYCDRHKLPIAERLRLFQLVCEGVQHAHQKAVIHRDIKPSNILVTEVDGKATPRIIDFGIAKALSSGVSPGMDDRTMFTRVGSVVGTLGYMSPEQAEGGGQNGGQDIDTRTDVYSLGIVLYELLIGALPFDHRKLTYFDMLRVLREDDAPRPSTRLRDASSSLAVAQSRGTDVAALVRQVRGDADSITLKAIEKDRNRRYASPADLAADIERYLSNEPVSAHAASFNYLARKYVRRHRVGVIVAAAGVLLLVGFAIAQSVQLRNVRRQRDRADRIAGFMTEMFKVSDPSESRGSTVTAREILDKSATQVERGLGFDTDVQSQLMAVMAETYMGLGLYGRAHDLADRTVAIRRQSFGENDPSTLASMQLMGTILYDQGRDLDAEPMLRKTLDLQSRTLGKENPATLETADALVILLIRHAQYVEAEKLERNAIEIETRTSGPDSLAVFRSMNNLGSALRGQNRFDEAEKVFRQLLESERRTLGADHPTVLTTMQSLAKMLFLQGREEEAEALYRQTIEIERRVLGPEHPITASTMSSLANAIQAATPRKAEAEALYREALAIQLRASGPDSLYTTRNQEGLANVLTDEHRYAEAEPILRQVIEARKKTLGPEHTDVLVTQYNLANVMWEQGHFAEAEKLTRQTLEQQTRVLDPNDLDIPITKSLMGRILLAEGHPQQAEEFARQAFDTQRRLLGPQHDRTELSLGGLVEAMARLKHGKEAQTLYRSELEQIQKLPHTDMSDTWSNFAEIAAAAGYPDDAFAYLNNAMQLGPVDAESLRTDENLKPLQKDPRFKQLLLLAKK